MKYGNIIFDGNRSGSVNIGDDLQLLAIERLYRYMKIDYSEVIRIPFSQLSSYNGESVILPISFPLYGYTNGKFITCFSDKIIPVFLGLSIMTSNLAEEDVDYLKKYQPIGCRDYYTAEVMRKYDLNAYVNGCLTLTLDLETLSKNVEISESKKQNDHKKYYLVDVSDKYMDIIPDYIKVNSIVTSQILEECLEPETAIRQRLMDYYNNAKLIVTTRLHCALPCLALGLPVVFIKDKYSFRFPTLSAYTKIYLEDEFDKIEWDLLSIDYDLLNARKEVLLECAARRVEKAFICYSESADYKKEDLIYCKEDISIKEMIAEINDLYEKEAVNNDSFIEHIDNVIEYIELNFSKDVKFKYAVWGITQKADMICSYLEANYKNAELVLVYDSKKKIEFHGLKSTNDAELLKATEVFVFVTTATANSPAIRLFSSIDKKNYHISTDGVMENNWKK